MPKSAPQRILGAAALPAIGATLGRATTTSSCKRRMTENEFGAKEASTTTSRSLGGQRTMCVIRPYLFLSGGILLFVLNTKPEHIAILASLFALLYLSVTLFRRTFALSRFILMAGFILYVLMVIDITMMPLPVTRDMPIYGGRVNLIPFAGIYDTITSAISSKIAAINVLGNVLLFMPLGLFVPLLWPSKSSVRSMLTIGLSSSLTIEAAQFTIGVILGQQYRRVDVDDVLLNVLGAILGYFALRRFGPALSAVIDLPIRDTRESQKPDKD